MNLSLTLDTGIEEDPTHHFDVQTDGPAKLIATELRTIADQIDPPFLQPEKS